MARKEGKKAAGEQQVLDHAARLFAEKGFGGTSLQDVADSMGLTRGAIYYYFPNKEALLAALVEEVTIGPARDVEAWHRQAKGRPSEQLRGLVRARAMYVLQRGQRIRVLELAESALPEGLAKRHRQAKRRILDEYSSIIAAGVLGGEFRPVDERVAAFGIIGMITWTAWWFDATRGRSADEVADQLSDMAVSSLLREEARRLNSGSFSEALALLREDLDHFERIVDGTEKSRRAEGAAARGSKARTES
jgi:AcrR family transcriptional regulator